MNILRMLTVLAAGWVTLLAFPAIAATAAGWRVGFNQVNGSFACGPAGDALPGVLRDGTDGLWRAAFLDGSSYEELARRIGSPLGSVKSWIRRGLGQLRVCLER